MKILSLLNQSLIDALSTLGYPEKEIKLSSSKNPDFGDISTRSNSSSSASSIPFSSGYTPTSTLFPTSLISLALINPLILCGFSLIILAGLLLLFLLIAIAVSLNY